MEKKNHKQKEKHERYHMHVLQILYFLGERGEGRGEVERMWGGGGGRETFVERKREYFDVRG